MSEPRAEPLTADQIEALAGTLSFWAERHPARNAPVLGFAFKGLALSPVEIAGAVRLHAAGKPDETSEAIVQMFRFATEVMPFEEILDELHETAEGPEVPELVPE